MCTRTQLKAMTAHELIVYGREAREINLEFVLELLDRFEDGDLPEPDEPELPLAATAFKQVATVLHKPHR